MEESFSLHLASLLDLVAKAIVVMEMCYMTSCNHMFIGICDFIVSL